MSITINHGSLVATKENAKLYSRTEGDFPYSSSWVLTQVINGVASEYDRGETEINPRGQSDHDYMIQKWKTT